MSSSYHEQLVEDIQHEILRHLALDSYEQGGDPSAALMLAHTCWTEYRRYRTLSQDRLSFNTSALFLAVYYGHLALAQALEKDDACRLATYDPHKDVRYAREKTLDSAALECVRPEEGVVSWVFNGISGPQGADHFAGHLVDKIRNVSWPVFAQYCSFTWIYAQAHDKRHLPEHRTICQDIIKKAPTPKWRSSFVRGYTQWLKEQKDHKYWERDEIESIAGQCKHSDFLVVWEQKNSPQHFELCDTPKWFLLRCVDAAMIACRLKTIQFLLQEIKSQGLTLKNPISFDSIFIMGYINTYGLLIQEAHPLTDRHYKRFMALMRYAIAQGAQLPKTADQWIFKLSVHMEILMKNPVYVVKWLKDMGQLGFPLLSE